MIAIVDYGLGNVLAFRNYYRQLNISVKIARTAADLTGCSKIILPGVGAFDHAMARLDASGMRETLQQLVIERKTPVLGICVGMQMLAASSEEGCLPGLGWIPGVVRRFCGPPSLALPHMGWNDVTPVRNHGLFAGFQRGWRFYFLHSYYFDCRVASDSLATTEYHGEFSSAVQRGEIYGVQFHPEKSHHWGGQLLKNFAEL